MDMAKFKSMFLSETGEHLRKMGSLLVDIEGNPEDQEIINALFREAHSIKGMAASMGYERMATLAHHLEDFLDQFRKDGKISSAAIDRLLGGVDLLEGLLEDISAELPEREIQSFIEQQEGGEEEAPQEAVTAEEASEASPRHLKLILHDDVDFPSARLLQIIGRIEELGKISTQFPGAEQIMNGEEHRQLHLSLNSSLERPEIEQAFQDYPEISALLFTDEPPPEERRRQRDRRQQPALGSGTVRVDTLLLDRFINLTGELVTNRHRLQTALNEEDLRELSEGLGQLGKLVKNLHSQVVQVRTMPVASVTERLPRVVRDLCRKNGKKVDLSIEGAEIELDRTILEEVADPLVHMVRNAIDHGIEQQGSVQLRIWRERSNVQIRIEDDGCGMDPQKIRQKALEKGLISSRQAQQMRDGDALQLICLPGFSTNQEVTETSGRGVGMDVVKAAVEKLGGTLLIESAPGQGSRLTMKLPLSVAIIRILLIECDGKIMALPISRILQTYQAERHEVQSNGKQLTVNLKGEKLPLLSLRKMLVMSVPPAVSQISIVVMEILDRKVGLVVDRIVGHQEVFVKKLPAPFDRLRGTNGGAILGDGRVVFILDIQGLLEGRRG